MFKELTMTEPTGKSLRVAAIQMTSGASVVDNLRAAGELIEAAATATGAELLLLPENFGLMGLNARDKLAATSEQVRAEGWGWVEVVPRGK